MAHKGTLTYKEKGNCVEPDKHTMKFRKSDAASDHIAVVNNSQIDLRFTFVVTRAEDREGNPVDHSGIKVLVKEPHTIGPSGGNLALRAKMGLGQKGRIFGTLECDKSCPHPLLGHSDWHIDC